VMQQAAVDQGIAINYTDATGQVYSYPKP